MVKDTFFLVGKTLARPDQVKKVLRKIQPEGVFSTLITGFKQIKKSGVGT